LPVGTGEELPTAVEPVALNQTAYRQDTLTALDFPAWFNSG